MEMKQIFGNNHYKVMEVTLETGESMPLHEATSDAFIVVKKGSAKIIFSDSEVELLQGSTQLIPANKQHRLEIKEAFNACIIFSPEAEIRFL